MIGLVGTSNLPSEFRATNLQRDHCCRLPVFPNRLGGTLFAPHSAHSCLLHDGLSADCAQVTVRTKPLRRVDAILDDALIARRGEHQETSQPILELHMNAMLSFALTLPRSTVTRLAQETHR